MILLYHRVTELPTDPQLLAVTPKHFAEHLEVIRRISASIPLRDLVPGNPLRHGVAVTFDDGYADNFVEAAPLLRRFDTPATVFIATANVSTRREFFWDELDRVLLQPGVLPNVLTLGSNRFELGDDAHYTQTAWETNRRWDVTQPDAPTARQRVYRDLCGLLHTMPTEQRDVTLHAVRTWAAAGDTGRQSHRVMTADEICELAAEGLMEVAAHTVTHPLLAAESVSRQLTEIERSKATLQAIVGRAVLGFSYPFGTRRSYDAATIDAVRAAGFSYACSNFTGRVQAGSDPYQLPRFIVRDWDGDEFERRLRAWLTTPNVQ